MSIDFSKPAAGIGSGSFPARLLGPNLPSAGEAVQARLSGEQLHLPGHQVSLQSLQLHLGADHQHAMLYWQDAAQYNWALRVDGAALTQLQQAAPPWFGNKLRKSDTASGARKVGQLLAVVCVAGVLLVLALLWGVLPWLADWGAKRVPVAQQEKLGRLVLAQIQSKNSGPLNWSESGPAHKVVVEIGTRLTQGTDYRYRWLIKKDATVNAFAIPGGIIVVHTGLLQKFDNADQLAAVLAHEVQHVEGRHSLRGMLHQLGWSALFTALWGDVGGIAGALASEAGTLQFSRELETESDRQGYRLLVKAGINPAGMVGVMQKFKQEAAKESGAVGVRLPQWLSSHPDTDARLVAAQQALIRQPCAACKSLQVDWASVQDDPFLR